MKPEKAREWAETLANTAGFLREIADPDGRVDWSTVCEGAPDFATDLEAIVAELRGMVALTNAMNGGAS